MHDGLSGYGKEYVHWRSKYLSLREMRQFDLEFYLGILGRLHDLKMPDALLCLAFWPYAFLHSSCGHELLQIAIEKNYEE